MAKIGTSLPEVAILMTIPGIALKSTLCIIAELGDIRRSHSANAINAYIGVDLTTYQSGDYTAEQHIRKRGNPLARKVLYRTVINIMSRLNRTIFHLVLNNEGYEPTVSQPRQ